jgi:hypothetical protein
MQKIFGVAMTLAFLTWCVSVAFKGMGPGPGVVFDELLDDRASISDLDGFVHKGDSYKVQLRFVAEEDWILALSHRGFRPTDCESVRSVIRFSLLRTAAWPPWRPEELKDAVCFRRQGSNKWSAAAREALLAEPEGGWVYFASEGLEHDRGFPDPGR